MREIRRAGAPHSPAAGSESTRPPLLEGRGPTLRSFRPPMYRDRKTPGITSADLTIRASAPTRGPWRTFFVTRCGDDHYAGSERARPTLTMIRPYPRWDSALAGIRADFSNRVGRVLL